MVAARNAEGLRGFVIAIERFGVDAVDIRLNSRARFGKGKMGGMDWRDGLAGVGGVTLILVEWCGGYAKLADSSGRRPGTRQGTRRLQNRARRGLLDPDCREWRARQHG